MCRFVCLALIVSLSAACATAEVARGSQIALKPEQSLAFLVIDSPRYMQSMLFERNDGSGDSFQFTDIPTGPQPRLAQVEAGEWCLRIFATERGRYDAMNRRSCFDIPAGKLAYLGHFVLEIHKGQGVMTPIEFRFENRRADAEAALAKGWRIPESATFVDTQPHQR